MNVHLHYSDNTESFNYVTEMFQCLDCILSQL